MDFSSGQNCFVNPADIFSFDSLDALSKIDLDTTLTATLDPLPVTADSAQRPQHQDSAVDLRLFTSNLGHAPAKKEDSADFASFLNTAYSTPASNTPSPHADMIFSNANSPGDLFRDQSQTSSPEDTSARDPWQSRSMTPDVIHIPQAMDVDVAISMDKTKTRAETQIKTSMVFDRLPMHYENVRFERHTLSKAKQLATDDEIQTNEKRGGTIRVHLNLVLATAVESKSGLERAMRRARGDEKTPRRRPGVPVNEIDKDDPAHPAQGGAVIICDGCKERERKRYDRKKKRNPEEEDEWSHYEDDRIIMINEKEFKRFQDVDSDLQHSPGAKKVEFAMRITCYCRHQEEKSPVGYRVIFTFKDVNNRILAQDMSEIIQITDDHKNRDLPLTDGLTSPLILSSAAQDRLPQSAQYAVPLYTYPTPAVFNMYSQPTTPVHPQFQSPFTTADAFGQAVNPAMVPQPLQQPPMAFGTGPAPMATATAQFSGHQRHQSYFNTPMVSPTDQMPQAGYPLHRPHSLDSFPQSFNFQYPQQQSYSQMFASQPPSRNVSRPASPSWDQGGRSKKVRAAPGFFMDDQE